MPLIFYHRYYNSMASLVFAIRTAKGYQDIYSYYRNQNLLLKDLHFVLQSITVLSLIIFYWQLLKSLRQLDTTFPTHCRPTK